MTVQGLYSDPDRPPPAQRKLKGWPRKDNRAVVDFRLPVNALDPGERWPRNFTHVRQAWFKLYDDLWNGDVSAVVEDPETAAVLINYFRRVLQVQAGLLTSTAPRPLAGGINAWMQHVPQYGTGYLVLDDGMIDSPRTSEAWEDEEGGLMIVMLAPNLTSRQQRRVRCRHIHADGLTEEWVSEWKGGVFGEQVGPVLESEGAWVRLDRLPEVGRVGESQLDDLVPPVVTIGLRSTGSNDVLTANEAPTTVIPTADNDIAQAVKGDPSQPDELQELGRRQAQEELVAMRGHNEIWASDGVDKGYVLEWTGNLDPGLMYMEWLDQKVGLLTGVWGILTGEASNASGVALAESRFAGLGATTRQMRNEAQDKLIELVGAEAEEWADPFVAPEPVPTADPIMDE